MPTAAILNQAQLRWFGARLLVVVDDFEAHSFTAQATVSLHWEDDQAFAPVPPTAFQEDGEIELAVDWRSLVGDDLDGYNPPPPPLVGYEEEHPPNFDWRANQYEDTEWHSAFPPPPPPPPPPQGWDDYLQVNRDWVALSYDDTEMHSSFPYITTFPVVGRAVGTVAAGSGAGSLSPTTGTGKVKSTTGGEKE